jgi:phage terminase small subunit
MEERTSEEELQKNFSKVGMTEISSELWNGFLEFIAEGGTGPVYLCGRGVTYARMLAWVKQDEERETALVMAETAGSRVMVKHILEELRRIGLVDIRRAYNEQGVLKPMAEIPAEVAAAIVSVETEEMLVGGELVGQVRKVKFSDKLRALELLGKNLQLFVDTSRVIHMGRVTLEDLVMQSIEPTKQITVEAIDGQEAAAGDGGEASERGPGDDPKASGGVSERTYAIVKASLDEGKS